MKKIIIYRNIMIFAIVLLFAITIAVNLYYSIHYSDIFNKINFDFSTALFSGFAFVFVALSLIYQINVSFKQFKMSRSMQVENIFNLMFNQFKIHQDNLIKSNYNILFRDKAIDLILQNENLLKYLPKRYANVPLSDIIQCHPIFFKLKNVFYGADEKNLILSEMYFNSLSGVLDYLNNEQREGIDVSHLINFIVGNLSNNEKIYLTYYAEIEQSGKFVFYIQNNNLVSLMSYKSIVPDQLLDCIGIDQSYFSY